MHPHLTFKLTCDLIDHPFAYMWFDREVLILRTKVEDCIASGIIFAVGVKAHADSGY